MKRLQPHATGGRDRSSNPHWLRAGPRAHQALNQGFTQKAMVSRTAVNGTSVATSCNARSCQCRRRQSAVHQQFTRLPWTVPSRVTDRATIVATVPDSVVYGSCQRRHGCLYAARAVWDLLQAQAHLDTGQGAEQHQSVEIPQVSDAKHFAFESREAIAQ